MLIYNIWLCISFQNTFATVRGKGGYNSHPTLLQAKSAIRAISWNNLLRPLSKATSCEVDEATTIISDIRWQCQRENADVDEIPNSSFSELDQLGFVDESASLSASLSKTKDKCDKEVLPYVLGSIIHRKVTCVQCQSELKGTRKCSLITYKEIEGCKLVSPNPEFVASIGKIEQFIFTNLKQIGHLPDISKTFYEEIVERNLIKTDFLKCKCNNSTKEILLKEIIKFFIRLFCKRTNEHFEKERHKNTEKIKSGSVSLYSRTSFIRMPETVVHPLLWVIKNDHAEIDV